MHLMENENTSFASISIPFLRSCSWSMKRDQNTRNTYVAIFHHNIQDDEASDDNFYDEVDCPN